MNLQYRIDLLSHLGEFILSGDPRWQAARERAGQENPWFIPEFVDIAAEHIARFYLQKNLLENWASLYPLPLNNPHPVDVGIVMAGNIPMVGFHDLISVFLSGHRAVIKPSSKDNVLIRLLIEKLVEFENEAAAMIRFSDLPRGCDAYITTGSNNTSRYFEYYFGKYPHIIRRNRTSVSVLDGDESKSELELLADDVYIYFGLGCRNVTKIYVPAGYDFIPLLEAFNKYERFASHHKYKNNYDYGLSLHILNRKYYMSNSSILLLEDPSLFSPISQLHYEYYTDKDKLMTELPTHPGLQCIIGRTQVPFGRAQYPALADYADGIDTLNFLSRL